MDAIKMPLGKDRKILDIAKQMGLPRKICEGITFQRLAKSGDLSKFFLDLCGTVTLKDGTKKRIRFFEVGAVMNMWLNYEVMDTKLKTIVVFATRRLINDILSMFETGLYVEISRETDEYTITELKTPVEFVVEANDLDIKKIAKRTKSNIKMAIKFLEEVDK